MIIFMIVNNNILKFISNYILGENINNRWFKTERKVVALILLPPTRF